MNNYYVYLHAHPVTKEVVYVGMGQGQRAWMMQNSPKTGPRYGHRSPPHFKWFKELEEQGFTLDEIVVLQIKNVSKVNARQIESHLIGVWNPQFNKHKGQGSMLDPQRTSAAKELRHAGLPYHTIGTRLGVSTMTARRYCLAIH